MIIADNRVCGRPDYTFLGTLSSCGIPEHDKAHPGREGIPWVRAAATIPPTVQARSTNPMVELPADQGAGRAPGMQNTFAVTRRRGVNYRMSGD